jgi:hypothetical protein
MKNRSNISIERMRHINMKKPILKNPVRLPKQGKSMNYSNGNLVKKSGCGCGKKKMK